MRKRPYFLSLAMLLSACSPESSVSQISDNLDEAAVVRQAILRSEYQISPLFGQGYSGVASIYLQNHPDYSDQSICSGTLITSRHVLTAAHCVADLSGKFALISDEEVNSDCQWTAGFVSSGTSELFNYMKVGFGPSSYDVEHNLYDIKSVVYHSGYAHIADAVSCKSNVFEGYEFVQNDIAIIELSEDVPESVATPIPVLPPSLKLTQEKIGKSVHLMFEGYGYSELGYKGILSQSSQPLTMYCDPQENEHYCKYGETLRIQGCHPNPDICRINGEYSYLDDKIAFPTKSFFYLQEFGGPCTGDSGGPGIINRGQKAYVAAITSSGDSVCRNYGISLAVQDYYDWIVKNVPEVPDYYEEICDNFLDDDNNGLIDHDDPACSNEPYCGDGIANNSELCDGNAFMDDVDECSMWSNNYESGKVLCKPDCTLDLKNCVKFEAPVTCGNGILEFGEHCDGGVFYSLFGEPMETDNCNEFSTMFTDGKLSCNPNCTVETSECMFFQDSDVEICGNSRLDMNERCDGTTFADGFPTDCAELDTYFSGGTIKCRNCELDLSECIVRNSCGDGLVSGDEPCDGDKFLLELSDCSDWSVRFKSGKVKCNQNCSVDYSDCVLNDEALELCGNGVLDSEHNVNGTIARGEECDGDLFLINRECSSWDSRYSGGTVSCSSHCLANLKACALKKSNVYDEDYGVTRVLNYESKPDIIAPVKSDDSVKFEKGSKTQKEQLVFTSLSVDPVEPVEPADPVDPDTPIVPEPNFPAESVEGAAGSGCSAAPSQSYPLSLSGLVLFACLLVRRKYRYSSAGALPRTSPKD